MTFDAAFAHVVLNPEMEGGLVLEDDPHDPGRMTYAGISSASWPNWEGWPVIRKARDEGILYAPATGNLLEPLVRAFYRKEFWDVWHGDELSDEVAEELFEQSVNLGVPRTARHLQQVLNVLNAREEMKYRFGPDLTVDGKFGPKTLARLKQVVASGRGRAVRNGVNCLQGARYVELALKNLNSRRYASGWLAKRAQ